MALDFPASASIGTTYQSGSSPTYTWNGSTWSITKTPPNIYVMTASYAPLRKNVSWVNSCGQSGVAFIADDRLYMARNAPLSHNSYGVAAGVLASGSMAGNRNVGLLDAYQIPFLTETSSVLLTASLTKKNGFALFSNGNFYGWGESPAGHLGIGITNPIYEPALLATSVSAFYPPDMTAQTDDSAYEKLLIKKYDGYIYGAGYNGRGGLGFGAVGATNVTTFSRIDGIGTNPLFVANIGSYYGGIIAQKSDNTIVGCGYNNNGWLGDGSTTQRNGFVTLSAWFAGDATMKIKKIIGATAFYNGTVFDGAYAGISMWISSSIGNGQKIMFAGNLLYGPAGNGRSGNTNVTTPISSSLPVTSRFTDFIYSSAAKSLYVWTGSSVYSWGKNDYGQLGYTTRDVSQNFWPSASLAVTGVVDILHEDFVGYDRGYQFAQSPVFKLTDGNYYMCGYGGQGALGTGENPTTTRVPELQKLRLPVSTSLKFIGTANSDAYYQTYVAVTDDNRFYAWGRNNGYNLIDNKTAEEFYSPVLRTPRILYI